jgi:hypothetical protein
VAGAVAVAAGNLAGAWWFALPLGVLSGLLVARLRPALLTAAVAGAAGWGLPLLFVGLQHPVWETAAVISGILGIRAAGPLGAIAATMLVGAVLGVAGAWVAWTARQLAAPARTRAR